MPFPLYRCPGVVVFLDDDHDYLESVADVLPIDWPVRLFQRPSQFIECMLEDSVRWDEEISNYQKIIHRWKDGASLIAELLRYWREDGNRRYSLFRVGVLDYSMPPMTGLEVLSGLPVWPGLRILLTGRADEQIALSAFNRGLIQKYITKQSATLRLELIDSVTNFLSLSTDRVNQVLVSTLSREQLTAINRPQVSSALESYANEHGWIEFAVIGAPFGVLSLDRHGKAGWLQLEMAGNLKELSEMAESQGWDAETVQDICDGRSLIDLELQLAVGARTQASPRPAFTFGSGADLVYACPFEIPVDQCPGFDASFEAFKVSLGSRVVED